MKETALMPAWKLWANPLIRRYIRARLRPQMLAVWLLLTVLLAAFVFLMVRTGAMNRSGMLDVDAERMPLTALMVIQAVILFFLGTGQVAGGITAEADEGVLDYQRLTPMTPLAKALGYLFGLPVREWVMFASTLPFTAWCLWRGQVPFSAWGPVYLVMITSAVLYHLTGLAAGLVAKNRRWAFLLSMGIIILLYTVLPQVSKFGLIFFEYITLWPVVNEQMMHLIPREAGGMMKLAAALTPKVSLFDLEFSEMVFTLFCQAGMGLTLLAMVWRRWRSTECHLLGKAWALGLFVWMQVLLLGNALPLIETGRVFPTLNFQRMIRSSQLKSWQPTFQEALFVVGIYGLVTMLLVLALALMTTPALDTQFRGLRRARKLSLPTVPRWSDAASALPVTLAMSVIGTLAWHTFAQAMITSKWFPGHVFQAWTLPVMFGVMLNATLLFQTTQEGWGKKRLFLLFILLGIVPPMAGAVLGMAADRLLPLTTWLSVLSPLSGPIVTPTVAATGTDLPAQIARAVPRSFGFWQSCLSLTVI
jgi:hypothetical protein